jgi:hypothetical protein
MSDAIELARAESGALRADAEAALPDISSFVIENDDDKEFAAELLREVKAKHRAADDRRKEITVPLNSALRSVNDLFRPALRALEEGERILKVKIAGYLEEREQERRTALAEAAETESASKATEALERAVVSGAPEGMSVRYRWVFEVVDADAVPREFCSPDAKKIGQVKPETPIAGVVWRQEPIVTARQVKS